MVIVSTKRCEIGQIVKGPLHLANGEFIEQPLLILANSTRGAWLNGVIENYGGLYPVDLVIEPNLYYYEVSTD